MFNEINEILQNVFSFYIFSVSNSSLYIAKKKNDLILSDS